MKSTSIAYTCGLNNGWAELATIDKEYYELSLKPYQGENTHLDYLTKDELIEIGEWLIALGKGKE